MAAPRPLNRSFENFGGVDREKSPLTTERIFARLAQNVALVNNTLTMQRGVKPVYTPAIISGAGNISVTHLLGLFQNTYDDSTIRAFQERLLLLYAYIPSNGAFSTSIRVDEITHNGSYL